MGYIEEGTVDTQGALVVVTAAGRRALGNRHRIPDSLPRPRQTRESTCRR
jgi:hypothetical protein